MAWIEFTAMVQKSPNKGGWHYASLPRDILGRLRKMAEKNGNVPVLVKIGKTDFKSTIMSRGNQQWYLAINSSVRESESISKGDTVTLFLAPDKSRLIKKVG